MMLRDFIQLARQDVKVFFSFAIKKKKKPSLIPGCWQMIINWQGIYFYYATLMVSKISMVIQNVKAFSYVISFEPQNNPIK